MKTVIQHIQSIPQPYLSEALQARDKKAYNRGEFEVKHVGQPEARVDMAMPELAGGIFRFDDCEGYTDTNSDQYETY